MDVMVELNNGGESFDHSEDTSYRLLSNDFLENSRNGNPEMHLPMDALNHAKTVDEEIVPPYEDYTNGLYYGQHSMHSDNTQVRVDNNFEGLEPHTNTCMAVPCFVIYTYVCAFLAL
jgi:hypothetical protein